jgi:hypothetical protein
MPETQYHMPYTEILAERLGGEYGGRPLVARDSDVRGTVCYDQTGEAIVTDPAKYPRQYDVYFADALYRASPDMAVERPQVLRAVFDTVKSRMAYSSTGVNHVLARAGADRLGDKIDLSSFMAAGVGVCRHQSLAVAATLERFKDEGHIRGQVSFERATRLRRGELDGHAWVRYTASSGARMILDVAQGYFGRLEDAPDGGRQYLRPEERQQALGGLVHNALSILRPGKKRR